MPITASQGGLSYIKVSDGPIWKYWIGKYSGNGIIGGSCFNSNTLYAVVNINNTVGFANYITTDICKINIGTFTSSPTTQLSPTIGNFNVANPNTAYCYMETIEYNSNTSSVIVTGQERVRAPNLNAILTEAYYVLNSSNLSISNQRDFFGSSASNIPSDRPTRSGNNIAVFNDGNFYISGVTQQYFANRIYYAHSVIAKFDNNGNILLTKRILPDGAITANRSTGGFSGITQLNNNTIIMSGSLDQTNTNPFSYFVASLDANLSAFNWKKKITNFSNTLYPNVRLITSDNTSNIYISTDTTSFGPGILKLDANGNIVWQKYFVGSATTNSAILSCLSYNNNDVYFGLGNLVGKVHSSNGEIQFVNRLSSNAGGQAVSNITQTSNNFIFTTQISAPTAGLLTNAIYNFPVDGTIPGSGNYILGNLISTYENVTSQITAIDGLYQTIDANISIQNDNSTNVASTNTLTGNANAYTFSRVS
jgi:hypothetical protein